MSDVISQTVSIEIRERLADGTYKLKNPKTTADQVIDTASKVLMLPAERTKLNGVATGAQVNAVTSVAGKIGAVTLVATNIAEETNKRFMTDAEKTKLTSVATNAQVNAVTTVAGRTGAVVVSKADVGLGSVENYAKASQAEAEAGTSDIKYMTPLRVKNATDKNTLTTVPQGSGSALIGGLNDKNFLVTHNLGRHAIIQYWGDLGASGYQNNYILANTTTSFTIQLRSSEGFMGTGSIYYEYW